ncbi:Methyltransferase small domain-containing protein [Actinacidiphila glaucinigra]|uniref:Methyltransferase small domain-containing protein n=1 Tax=Actinacidiphila glaucinigra TaxID=235986 RepID=A0A239HS28_9ACTN|nr:Methyltransferase small domain-containing protein [Actinacidiphila glaucinigra]
MGPAGRPFRGDNGSVSTQPPPQPLPAPDRTAALRDALRAAAFTADGCLDLLGATAYAALSRAETVPALRATRGGSPLESLVRLFLLQQPVPYARLREVLPLDAAIEDGWLVRDGDEVRATVDVRPYGGDGGEDWYIVSDLGCAVGGANGIRTTPGVDRADLVLGVGGASTTLAGITVRTPVARALDLGTGSGTQALHASRHATRVTATDLNPRALHFTRLTLALSGAPEPDVRQGSLFEPVGGERYDLIVSNPPFVISPGSRFTYRDGGMAGDDLCRTVVRQAADHLTEGGYLQLLANWEHTEGEDWRDRVAAWVPDGCDAWIVQREVQDVTQYAELWLRDGGDHLAGPEAYAARYGAWLDAFEQRKTKAVGFGWITVRRTGSDRPVVTAEEWPHPVEQPLGPHIEAWFGRQDFLRTHNDAALLDECFRLADEVVQEQVGLPGAEDPEHVVLRANRGMRRATRVDTVGAGFAGVCDGTLTAGRILDAIAQLLGEDPVALRDRTPEAIRLLVEQGFIEPV